MIATVKRHFRSTLALCVVVFVGVCSQPAAAREPLRIGGAGAATGVIRLLTNDFTRIDGRTAVQIPADLGSAGGIQAVIAGALDLAVTARPVTAEEAKAGVKDVLWAQTPLAFVSSYPHHLGLKSSAAAQLFASPRATWPDGGPVRLIMRPPNEMDLGAALAGLPGMEAALAAARRRADIPVAATAQDNADLAQKMEGSLTVMGLSQIITERPKLRILPLDGVRPSLDAMGDGSYRLAQTFHLVLPPNPNQPAKRFLVFLSTAKAKRILQEGGAAPVARIAAD